MHVYLCISERHLAVLKKRGFRSKKEMHRCLKNAGYISAYISPCLCWLTIDVSSVEDRWMIHHYLRSRLINLLFDEWLPHKEETYLRNNEAKSTMCLVHV